MPCSSARYDRQVETGEDLRDLVHEGDVDVALGVLDRLGRFRRLDRRGAEHAAGRDRAVHLGDAFEHFGRLAGDDLGDLLDGMLAVAGIDALGAVAEEEIPPADEARGLLEDGGADLLGHAGIDSAFVNHDRLDAGGARGREHAAHGARGGFDEAQVRLVRGVDRRRHGDDVEVGRRDGVGIGGQRQRQCAQPLVVDLAGAVMPVGELRDPLLVDIEADGFELAREGGRERQPHVAKTDHANPGDVDAQGEFPTAEGLKPRRARARSL